MIKTNTPLFHEMSPRTFVSIMRKLNVFCLRKDINVVKREKKGQVGFSRKSNLQLVNSENKASFPKRL